MHARLLSSMGNHVWFATHPRSELIEDEGFEQVFYPEQVLARTKKSLSVASLVKQLVERNKIDIIISHIDPPASAAHFLDLGIPVIGFIHLLYDDIGMIGRCSWEACMKLKSTYPNFMLSAVSNFQREHFKNWSLSKGKDWFDFLIPNMVIQEDLPVPALSEGYGCYIGRPTASKHVLQVIDMFEARNDRGFIFVNSAFIPMSSPDYEYLQKIRDRVEKSPNVTLLENLPHDEIMTYLGKAKYVVISHYMECAPVVAFEAACRGVPAVYFTQTSGQHATVETYGGLGCFEVLTKVKSRQYCFDINDDYRSRKGIQDHVQARCNLDKWIENYNQVLMSAMTRAVPSRLHTFF